MNIKNIIREALLDFRNQFSQYLTFFIIYSIAIALIIVPASIWLMNVFVSTTGNAALSDYALAQFLLSPFGIMTLIIGGAIVMAFAFTRDAGTMFIGFSNEAGTPIDFRTAFMLMLRRLWSILLLNALIVGIALVVAVPFLIIGFAIYKAVLPGDINYYLSYKPPEFRQAVMLIGIVVLGLLIVFAYLYVTFSFMLPALLFRDKRGRAALSYSRQLVKGRFFKIATLRVGWLLLAFAVTFLIQAIYWRIGQVIFEALASTVAGLVLVSAGLIVTNAVVLAIGNFLRTTLTALFALHLYEAVGAEKGVALGTVPELDSAETHAHWRIPRFVYGVAAIGVVVAIVFVALGLQNNIPTSSYSEIIAHRGGAIAAPENTLAAIEQGLLDGAEVVEIDVQETKDGVIVLLHDADIRRVTGVAQNIWDVNYDEIKDLDAGSWFDPAFADERIPTLDQALDLIGDRAITIIELKYYGHDEALAQRVVDIVEARGIEDQVRIMSLVYDGVQETQQINPDLETGLLAIVTVGDMTTLDIDFLAMSAGAVDRDFVAEAHAKDIEVAVWTLNEVDDMVRFIDMGVDSLITDRPATVLDVSAALAEMSPVERALIQAHQFFGFGRNVAYSEQ